MEQTKTNNKLVVILMIIIGIGLCFYLFDLFFNGKIWSIMEPSRSGIVGEYCEFDYKTDFIRQKANTYSNLFYGFIGLCILFFRPKNQNQILISYMAWVYIYLCLGSAFFHASLTRLGQLFDMNATYGLNIALVFLCLGQVINFKGLRKWLLLGIIIFIQILFIVLWPYLNSTYMILAFVLFINLMQVYLYFKHKNTYRVALMPLAFFILFLAVKIRTNDVQKLDCDPNSWFQGHALWHILTGISTGLSYLYLVFRKENI